MAICPRYALMCCPCACGWRIALRARQSDAKIECQEGLPVVVRLAAATHSDRIRMQRRLATGRSIGRGLEFTRCGLSAEAGQQCIARGNIAVARPIDGADDVTM